jgi:hypothetical protein
MRARTLVTLAVLAGAALAGAARGELPEGRGVLLPLQDRVGRFELAERAEALLRMELEERADLVEAGVVRQVLRSMRVRDASQESPERVAELAARLESEWFFLAALHEARDGREPQRFDGEGDAGRRVVDAGDTPQLVISALVVQLGSPELWWAGFVGASGRDGERIFGLGGIESLEELLPRIIGELVTGAVDPAGSRPKRGLRRRSEGYLRPGGGPVPPQRVAVIPMDSVATLDPSASAEVATAALFAALDDFGFKTLLPGLVQAIRQDQGRIQYGGVGRSEWQALAGRGGASWIATGTVESYRTGLGRSPDPWVAFSVRLLDAADGEIVWSSGLERYGRDTGAAFERGRIYSAGGLAYAMMRSLVAELPRSDGAGN